MLRITEQRNMEHDSLTVTLEGRLAGQWVKELTRYLGEASVNGSKGTTIDLTGVTFIDAEGKVLLAHLSQQGVRLRASGCLTRSVVEEITRADKGQPLKKMPKRSIPWREMKDLS